MSDSEYSDYDSSEEETENSSEYSSEYSSSETESEEEYYPPVTAPSVPTSLTRTVPLAPTNVSIGISRPQTPIVMPRFSKPPTTNTIQPLVSDMFRPPVTPVQTVVASNMPPPYVVKPVLLPRRFRGGTSTPMVIAKVRRNITRPKVDAWYREAHEAFMNSVPMSTESLAKCYTNTLAEGCEYSSNIQAFIEPNLRK
jgi:hypothetical protein